MKMALAQVGDVEFVRTQAFPDERVWIKVTNPAGEVSADIGILVTGEGFSIDVWPTEDDGCGSPVIAPWILWSDIEEGSDENIQSNEE